MEKIIKIEKLSKKYKNVQALKNINIEIDSGKVIGLLGPNGSGKTTLIKILAGMIRNYDGRIYINGKKWSDKSKALISYLPDTMIFDQWKSTDQLIKFYDDMFKDFDPYRVEELIRRFDIDTSKSFNKLSKGNKEKLQLAFVLARNARLYLFDEPIGGVDPSVREIILETIMEYRETDATVILSTHQIYDVENLFDEVIFLKKGKALFHENTKQLVRNNGLSLVNIFKKVYKNVS